MPRNPADICPKGIKAKQVQSEVEGNVRLGSQPAAHTRIFPTRPLRRYRKPMAHILILAALPEEANALFPDVGERSDDPFAVRRIAADGHEVAIATCGLGKVNAALVVGVLGGDADLIMMTGTCGSLGAPPGAYWIAEALQHDYGATEPGRFRRYRAGDWPIGEPGRGSSGAHFAAMADPGLDLPHARIASGDSFIACPDAAADLTSLGATLVDMEVGAVAQAAMASAAVHPSTVCATWSMAVTATTASTAVTAMTSCAAMRATTRWRAALAPTP